MTTTFILGGAQSDFARNLKREDQTISDLCGDIIAATLSAACVDVEQVESVHVGNAFGQLYNGQGHLGALPATVVPQLWGVPSMRHEAACASGSLAILSAMSEIEAGRYDCVLVLGLEQEKTLPAMDAARVQAAAAYVGHEDEQSGLVWPTQFARLADAYDERYGLDDNHLRAIGEINLTNAKANPNAQTRGWTLTKDHVGIDDSVNPVLAGRLRRNDCCPLTDGAAGLVLVSDRWLAKEGRQAGACIAGWGHTTVGLPLAAKLERASSPPELSAEVFLLPHVRQAITAAHRRAGVDSAKIIGSVDVIETHDCLTPSEYMAIDHFGLTPPGESFRAIEDGTIAKDGALPMNPSGGLIGGGHPVGATGIRMALDAFKQVTASAGEYQIPGAKRAHTLNIGGSTSTTVSFVVDSVA